MNHFISIIFLISAFFICPARAEDEPEIEHKIKQHIQILEQKQSEMLQALRVPNRIDPPEQQQQIDEKMKQPCGDFCRWRNKDFISLENMFTNFSGPVFQDIRSSLLKITHDTECHLDKLMPWLRENKMMLLESGKIQKSVQSIHTTRMKMQKLIHDLKEVTKQINNLEGERKNLEFKYNICKNKAVKIKIVAKYDSLMTLMKQWSQDDESYHVCVMSIMNDEIENIVGELKKMTQ